MVRYERGWFAPFLLTLTPPRLARTKTPCGGFPRSQAQRFGRWIWRLVRHVGTDMSRIRSGPATTFLRVFQKSFSPRAGAGSDPLKNSEEQENRRPGPGK